MTNYYQIACGDGRVDLREIFLKIGVALLGPGSLGDFYDHLDEYRTHMKKNSLSKEFDCLKMFAVDTQVNDILVLRSTKDEVIAVGIVVGPYRYEPIFKSLDIDQWDMQHCRRVKWYILDNPLPGHRFSPNRYWPIKDETVIAMAEGFASKMSK